MAFIKNSKYEVLTVDGFKNFDGYNISNKETIKLEFDRTEIICTGDHKFFSIDRNDWVDAASIKEFESIRGKIGSYQLLDKSVDTQQEVVDLVNVESTHSFLANELDAHNCLYLDEYSFVRPSIAKAFWTSITPTLATGGKSIITSTPNSDEDQFALIWKEANKTEDEFGNLTDIGINGYKAFSATWKEHPDRDEAWAKSMRQKLGDDRFEREIECRFLVADETLINPNTLIMLQGKEPVYREGQVRWYKKPEKGGIYVIGLDPSLGTGGDPAAIQVFDASTTEQVAEWKHNKTDIPGQIKLLATIASYIKDATKEPNNIYYSVENNAIGEAALISLAEYGEHNIPGTFMSERGKQRKGYTTTHRSKIAACSKFKTLLESKKLQLSSFGIISELKSFVASGNSYSAKIGETDDLVMASLLVTRMMTDLSEFNPAMEARLRDHETFVAPLPFYAVFG